MRPLVTFLLLLFLIHSIHADPSWEKKDIDHLRIEVPSGSKTTVQTKPGTGAVQKMTKYSFKTGTLDLELVFLTFPPGFVGNLDGAAANMGAQIKAASGEESLPPWKTTTVSARPARYLATKPNNAHQARQVTLIDDTHATNQLVIIDISYDTNSSSGKIDSERVMMSAEIK